MPLEIVLSARYLNADNQLSFSSELLHFSANILSLQTLGFFYVSIETQLPWDWITNNEALSEVGSRIWLKRIYFPEDEKIYLLKFSNCKPMPEQFCNYFQHTSRTSTSRLGKHPRKSFRKFKLKPLQLKPHRSLRCVKFWRVWKVVGT